MDDDHGPRFPTFHSPFLGLSFVWGLAHCSFRDSFVWIVGDVCIVRLALWGETILLDLGAIELCM
jgi:hypothetical protein